MQWWRLSGSRHIFRVKPSHRTARPAASGSCGSAEGPACFCRPTHPPRHPGGKPNDVFWKAEVWFTADVGEREARWTLQSAEAYRKRQIQQQLAVCCRTLVRKCTDRIWPWAFCGFEWPVWACDCILLVSWFPSGFQFLIHFLIFPAQFQLGYDPDWVTHSTFFGPWKDLSHRGCGVVYFLRDSSGEC